jgi:hypothetical protein
LRVRRRGETPPDVVIQVGLTGRPGTPQSRRGEGVHPILTSPRPLATSRSSSSFAGASSCAKRDPNHCAIAAYHESWERPVNGFADRVLATAAKADAPDFECQPGQETTPAKSALRGTSRNTTPATAPFRTPDDDERAHRSPLFPVMAKPFDSSPAKRSASDRTAAGQQKNEARTVPSTPLGRTSTACSCHVRCSNPRRNLK